MKTQKVNIGIEEERKFMLIGDYWDTDTIIKVAELLHEYQEIFPMKFSELKGIVEDLRVMRITLKPDVKPVKQ